MSATSKFKNIAVFIEVVSGAGLAIFFHWIMNMPQAAHSILGIGILLSYSHLRERQCHDGYPGSAY